MTVPVDWSDPAGWRDRAACRALDPDAAEAFFPVAEPGTPAYDQQAGPALEVCGGCRVDQACLDFALANRIRDGVWGGTTQAGREAGRLSLTRGAA